MRSAEIAGIAAKTPQRRGGQAELDDRSAGMTLRVVGEWLENCMIDVRQISRATSGA